MLSAGVRLLTRGRSFTPRIDWPRTTVAKFLHGKAVDREGHTARFLVPLAISRGIRVASDWSMARRRKNPHAMALGKLGGMKGGRARAEKLSARRRREIARHAANVRWHSE